jgi:hypothetical protein
MKLITTNADLRTNLSRLAKKYPNIAFAVAWASAGTEIFKELSANRNRIRKAVIGTHFYQMAVDWQQLKQNAFSSKSSNGGKVLTRHRSDS